MASLLDTVIKESQQAMITKLLQCFCINYPSMLMHQKHSQSCNQCSSDRAKSSIVLRRATIHLWWWSNSLKSSAHTWENVTLTFPTSAIVILILSFISRCSWVRAFSPTITTELSFPSATQHSLQYYPANSQELYVLCNSDNCPQATTF